MAPRRPKLRPEVADQVEALARGDTNWGIGIEQFRSIRDHPDGFAYQLYHVYVAVRTTDGSPPGGRGTLYTRRDGIFNTPEELLDYMDSTGFDDAVEDEENGYYVTSIVYVLPKDARVVPGARGRYSSYES